VILSKAFVFTEKDLNDGTGTYSVGMENAFHTCYKWVKDDSNFSSIIGQEVTLSSFPFNNCYSRHSWDLLLQVMTLIAPHTSKNIPSVLTMSEFQYLKLRMMPDVEVYTKNGVSTNIQPRKCAARESVKQRSEKRFLRVDTHPKFDELQGLLETAIAIGLRAQPPSVPSLRVADNCKTSFVLAGKNDTVNLFFPLPAESFDGTSHSSSWDRLHVRSQPKARGPSVASVSKVGLVGPRGQTSLKPGLFEQ
jgi:hypothetical protein